MPNYYQLNRESMIKASKRYREKNKDQINERAKIHMRELSSLPKVKKRRTNYNNLPEVKERKRCWVLWNSYGLTPENHNQLFVNQEGNCAICGRNQSEFKKLLYVDHLHIEGYDDLPPEEKGKYVRGLLCSTCNSAIGLLFDSSSVCYQAGNYIKAYEDTNQLR